MSAFNICAFGNSLTAGFGLPEEASLPRQLHARLEADGICAVIANHGLSGDTTAGGLGRILSALLPGPDLVLLELGINDILMGIPPKRIKANLEQLIQACLQTKAGVLLAGFTAVSDIPPADAEEFNTLYPELARTYDLTLFPDFLGRVAGNPELTLPDGLHPNPRGIAWIVNRLAPAVHSALEALGGENT
jgi:acyl-CoA thioesterase-1